MRIPVVSPKSSLIANPLYSVVSLIEAAYHQQNNTMDTSLKEWYKIQTNDNANFNSIIDEIIRMPQNKHPYPDVLESNLGKLGFQPTFFISREYRAALNLLMRYQLVFYRYNNYWNRDFVEKLIDLDSLENYVSSREHRINFWKHGVGKIHSPGNEGIGSGFFYNKEIFVTNKHVIEDLSKKGNITIEMDNGKIFILYQCIVSQWDDIAIVIIKEKCDAIVPILIDNKNVGQDVFSFGYPIIQNTDDAYLFCSVGIISSSVKMRVSLCSKENPDRLVANYLAKGGKSGGPVFNSDGYIIGIHCEYAFQQLPQLGTDSNRSPIDINPYIGTTLIIPTSTILGFFAKAEQIIENALSSKKSGNIGLMPNIYI